jgi:hypothetical protein
VLTFDFGFPAWHLGASNNKLVSCVEVLMSYDLYFWGQEKTCDVDPQSTMESLITQGKTNHTMPISIDNIISDIEKTFPKVQKNIHTSTNELIQLVVDFDDNSVALISWGDHYFMVESHGCSGEILNQFIDIAVDNGTVLYDPQTNERYGS